MPQLTGRLHRVDVEKHWGVPGDKARVAIERVDSDDDDDPVARVTVRRDGREWAFDVSERGVAVLEDVYDVPDWLHQLLLNAGVREVVV